MKRIRIKNIFSVKRILVVACSLLVLIVLFTIAFEWYFNPARLPEDSPLKARARKIADLKRLAFIPGEMPGRKDVEALVQEMAADNAAKYFLMAALEVKGSPRLGLDKKWERMPEISERGWRTEEPEVDELLQENEPVFELVRKGIQCSYCSFPEEDLLDMSSTFTMGAFRNIARLYVGKAKYYEKERAFDKARETYTDALRFFAAVADSGDIAQTLTGMAMESLIYHALAGYFKVLDDEPVCEQFLADLVAIEKSRGSLHDALEREFAYTHRLFENYDFALESRYQLYYGGLNGPFDDLPEDQSEKPLLFEYVLDAFTRAGGYIFNRIWTPIYMKRSRRQFDEFATIALEASKQPYPELLRTKLEEKFPANTLASMLLPAIVPKFFIIYGRSEVNRRAMIIRTALHLHFLRNGAFPEALGELDSIVPEEMLIDPFSIKPFMYRRTDKGYMFYSFGSDLDDDGGTNFDYKQNDGDLVFAWPEQKCEDQE